MPLNRKYERSNQDGQKWKYRYNTHGFHALAGTSMKKSSRLHSTTPWKKAIFNMTQHYACGAGQTRQLLWHKQYAGSLYSEKKASAAVFHHLFWKKNWQVNFPSKAVVSTSSYGVGCEPMTRRELMINFTSLTESELPAFRLLTISVLLSMILDNSEVELCICTRTWAQRCTSGTVLRASRLYPAKLLGSCTSERS
jgi:hypothetical protein